MGLSLEQEIGAFIGTVDSIILVAVDKAQGILELSMTIALPSKIPNFIIALTKKCTRAAIVSRILCGERKPKGESCCGLV
jgi:hypothetical protein